MMNLSSKHLMLFIIMFYVAISQSFAQKKVVLDNYYNNEYGKKSNQPYHYLWEDKTNSGFSELGNLFIENGATISTLKAKPNAKNLKNASIYIIVDPDNYTDNENPNFMDKKAANSVANWVKKGGILLLMTNDSSNCELDKFNLLTSKFGFKYNKDLNHPELRGADKKIRNFPSCAFTNLPNHPVFEGVNKIFIKEISSITCTKPARTVLAENGKTYIAEVEYGKGYVFAVGDPWLYNEYIDHAVLTPDFENLKAAQNLVKLLLSR